MLKRLRQLYVLIYCCLYLFILRLSYCQFNGAFTLTISKNYKNFIIKFRLENYKKLGGLRLPYTLRQKKLKITSLKSLEGLTYMIVERLSQGCGNQKDNRFFHSCKFNNRPWWLNHNNCPWWLSRFELKILKGRRLIKNASLAQRRCSPNDLAG